VSTETENIALLLAQRDLDLAILEVTRANETAKGLQQATAAMATIGGALGTYLLRNGGSPVGGGLLVAVAVLLGVLFERTVLTLAPRLPTLSAPPTVGWLAPPPASRAQRYLDLAITPLLGLGEQIDEGVGNRPAEAPAEPGDGARLAVHAGAGRGGARAGRLRQVRSP
jgi:hypothetical protein